jgi:hypothetical protein
VGVKRPGKVYRLVWPDDDALMAGVEVRMKGLSIRRLLQAQALVRAGVLKTADDGGADEEAVKAVFDLIADNLISWNLEEDDTEDEEGNVVPGGPVPTTLNGVLSLELDPVVDILTEWLEAIASVAPPLSRNSSAGEPSEEQWGPMEPIPAESLSS